MKTVTATEYKHNALRLLEEVHQTGETVQITKRGKAYAQLNPIEPQQPPKRVFGQSEGIAKIVGDIVGPIHDREEWGEDAW